MTSGDFNMDSIPDYCITLSDAKHCGADSNAAVYLARPDGSLQNPIMLGTDLLPSEILVGNFDSDAPLDIVTVNYGNPTLSFLGGITESTFAKAITFPTGAPPYSHWFGASADFNGDAIADIVVPEFNGDLFPLLGRGNGTFAPAPIVCAAGGNTNVVVADFNGDSLLDVATASSDTGSVSILLGRGNGTFEHAIICPISGQMPCYSEMAVADLNGDCAPDLLFAGGDFGETKLFALVNDGHGHLHQSFESESIETWYATFVIAADVDGDLNVDAVLGFGANDVIGVAKGNGDGTFLAPKTYYAGHNPVSSVFSKPIGKLPARLISVFNSSSDLAITACSSVGELGLPRVFLDSGEAIEVAVADFNRDGKLDFATASPGSREVGIALGNGQGHFSKAPGPVHPGFTCNEERMAPESIATGDFDHDGNPDVAVSSPNARRINVLFGRGDATFAGTIVALPTDYTVLSIASVDINSDGNDDILAQDAVSDKLYVFSSSGDRTFGTRTDYKVGGGPSKVRTADLDGDGNLDVVLPVKSPAGFSVLKGTPDGRFKPIEQGGGATEASSDLVLVDFDGDCRVDMCLVTERGTLLILPGMGDLTFGEALPVFVPNPVRGCVAGDFDGDGLADLAVSPQNEAGVLILKGRGDLTFASSVAVQAPVGLSLMSADIDKDGDLDLLIPTGTAQFACGILLNVDNSPPTSRLSLIPQMAQGELAVGLAYYSQDSQSGIASTELWVRAPGTSEFVSGGVSGAGNQGSLDYLCAMGVGKYEFASRAVDKAGNWEAYPTMAEVAVMIEATGKTGAGSEDVLSGAIVGMNIGERRGSPREPDLVPPAVRAKKKSGPPKSFPR
ncbi:MAG: VCBS repeat-containing protein [Candidatus Sumerlaeaceae bacterium]|nr:VCBS repeat-containing protein [Candidatus Sumerlaeaceae bacterium]